ncbi:MAG: hypothetical protein ABI812_05945 [Betaproteobacteria bacterium]
MIATAEVDECLAEGIGERQFVRLVCGARRGIESQQIDDPTGAARAALPRTPSHLEHVGDDVHRRAQARLVAALAGKQQRGGAKAMRENPAAILQQSFVDVPREVAVAADEPSSARSKASSA